MAIQKTEAIILKTQPLRSSSLIVTVFTRDFGKIKGIAKGVRQEREIRGAHFELFNQLELVYYEKQRSDLHLISDTMLTDAFPALRGNLEALVFASYFCDLTDHLCEVHDPNSAIFELLQFAFKYLPAIASGRLSRLFEIKLLHEAGWLPHLEGCLECQTPLEAGFFSARQGALFCSQCVRQAADAKALAREPLAVMRYFIHHDLSEAVKMSMTRKTEIDLEVFMKAFLAERLNAPLKSSVFLDKIRPVLA